MSMSKEMIEFNIYAFLYHYKNIKMSFTINLRNEVNSYDFKRISQEFCDTYYKGMSLTGLSKLLYLFHSQCKCTFITDEVIGEHNILIKLAENNVSRVLYDKLTGNVHPVDNNKIMINITGVWQAMTFQNQYTELKGFSETFVLEIQNQTAYVINHMFRWI